MTGWATGWLTGWLACCLDGQVAACPAGWLAGLLEAWFVDWRPGLHALTRTFSMARHRNPIRTQPNKLKSGAPEQKFALHALTRTFPLHALCLTRVFLTTVPQKNALRALTRTLPYTHLHAPYTHLAVLVFPVSSAANQPNASRKTNPPPSQPASQLASPPAAS